MVTRENHKLCRQSDRKTVPFQLVAVSTVGEKSMGHSQMPMPCKLSLQPANCQFQLVADIAGGAQRNKNNDNNILFDLAAVGSTSASVGLRHTRSSRDSLVSLRECRSVFCPLVAGVRSHSPVWSCGQHCKCRAAGR